MSAARTPNLSRFEDLPEDVLLQFAKLASEEYGVDSIIALSHVSTHIRSIIAGHAAFWTKVTSISHIDLVKACVERSKDAGLRVHLHIEPEDSYIPGEVESFLDVVSPTAARWESLTITSPPTPIYYPQLENAAVTTVLKQVQDRALVTFPRLKSLYLAYNLKALQNVDGCTFHTGWLSAPCLQQFTAVNFIPRPSLVTDNITSLKLQYSEKRRTLASDILTFLASLTNLEELNIVLQALDIEFPLQEVCLPTLNHFMLRIPTAFYEHPLLVIMCAAAFMHAISMPNLESYSSSFEFPYQQVLKLDRHQQALTSMLPNPAQHLKLKSVNFAVFVIQDSSPYSNDDDDVVVDPPMLVFPLYEIPQVEHFSFATDFPFTFLCAPAKNDDPPSASLKHLTLTCPKLRGGSLFETVEKLEDAGMWSMVEDVHFVGCSRLTSRELNKIVDTERMRLKISN